MKLEGKHSISVVVPVYNSAGTLQALCERIDHTLTQLVSKHEIVLVNDSSADNSWEVILSLSEKHSHVSGINLMRNYGQHNALLCGIRNAKYSLIVTLDDDLQNPPEEIPLLYNELVSGYDVVYGKPERERHGLFRDVASRVTKLTLQHAMGAEVAGNVSAFRIFRTALREGFKQYHGAFVSIDVLLSWGAQKFSAIHVKHEIRASGVSNYTFRKLVTHAFNMMTGFSTIPLQLASIIGFVFTLFGFGILLFVLVRYIMLGSVVPGFAFLASIVTIFSGAQMFAIGIIGEYLARMHFRIMDKPSYVIREKTEHHGDA